MASSTTSLPIESYDAFKALTTAQQSKIVASIAKDRTGGLSGNDLRDKYGSWLTGPRRCKLLHASGNSEVVGRSYEEYDDDTQSAKIAGGKLRKGTRHARLHGQGTAAQRRREEIANADKDALMKIGRRQNRRAAQARKATAKTAK